MPTSKLQKKIHQELKWLFGPLNIFVNTKPSWLKMKDGTRLELDFYLPQLQIAFEVQGQQHFRHIAHFHPTEDAFLAQCQRDVEKKKICKRFGVTLFEIETFYDFKKLKPVLRGLKVEGSAVQEMTEPCAFNEKALSTTRRLSHAITQTNTNTKKEKIIMPRIGDIHKSTYLKVDDLQKRRVALTISDVTVERIGDADKFVMHFQETDKLFAMNITNCRMMEMLTESDDSDKWIGTKITLRPDMTTFNGKPTPCIRIDSELPQQPNAQPLTNNQQQPSDVIPF